MVRAIIYALGTAALIFIAEVAYAQCHPSPTSNEARLLSFFATPLAFSADAVAIEPLTASRGRVRLSFESAYVPSPSAERQRTEYCYTGKVQHTSLTSFFGRPRVAIALPAGAGLELSYLPPVKLSEATPNLFGAALWITREVRGTLALTARTHLTRGTVHGPITCPKDGIQQTDPSQPCYGTAPSDDEFQPNMFGVELIASAPWRAGSRVRWHGGIGVNALRPRFQVDFSDLLGGRDQTSIEVNLTRVTALLGASVRVSERCHVATQGYASFGDTGTIRGTVGCALVK
jgi:hypothetical protein